MIVKRRRTEIHRGKVKVLRWILEILLPCIDPTIAVEVLAPVQQEPRGRIGGTHCRAEFYEYEVELDVDVGVGVGDASGVDWL